MHSAHSETGKHLWDKERKARETGGDIKEQLGIEQAQGLLFHMDDSVYMSSCILSNI